MNHVYVGVLVGLLFGVVGLPCANADDVMRVDLLLTNGTVHTGDGSEPFTADVAVLDGKLYRIGPGLNLGADMILNCSGLVVCPGFIDLHSHSDGEINERDTRANINFLMQGCTTVVTGNCGFGPVDVAKYLKDIDDQGAGTHVAHLLGQGTLREEVLGSVNRSATDAELARMKELADKAMRDGAFGMSTGLIYIPGTFTQTSELVEIAQVVAAHRGIYASHIRNEGADLLASVKEALHIGTQAGLPVHVSHFKASGKPAWGQLRLAIELIEKARANGQTVTADQYPYIASSTSLDATLLPPWSREGGHEGLEKRLAEPETAARIREEIVADLGRTGRIQIASFRRRPEYVGRSLDEIATDEKVEVADLVMAIERDGGAAIVHFGMNEDEVRSAMPLPWVATASDGTAKVADATMPHPRSLGTFSRKIGRYAIEEEVLPLADAIRSSSGLPAEIIGLTDRGQLKEGLAADVTVFDPKTFRDQATFTQPFLPTTGITHVLVEGKLAVYAGSPTGRLAGRALRKSSSDSTSSNQ